MNIDFVFDMKMESALYTNTALRQAIDIPEYVMR